MGLVHRIVLPCLIGGSLGFTMLGCSGKSTNPPSIAAFSPAQGPVGNDLIITGSGFTSTSAVSIGGVAVATFTVNDDNQITAFVPAAAISGAIVVSNSAGTSTTNAAFYIMPGISSLTDTTNGSTMNPGDTVTISGSGFTGATAVAFYGPTATLTGSAASPVSTPQTTYTVNGANQISTTVPSSLPPGAGYVVQVTAPGSGSANTCASSSFIIQ